MADILSIGLLADFNVQNLAALLRKKASNFSLQCTLAPFGQTATLLLDNKADFWSVAHDALVVWTAPERALPTFRKALALEEYSQDELLNEVDWFTQMIEQVPETVRTILVPSWVSLPADRGWGVLDMADGIGVAHALMRMNLRLAENTGRNRRVVLLDTQRWVSLVGAGGYNPKLWYLSKTPFHVGVFEEACNDILSTLDATAGRSKKIVILDLDNTLWGGVVGEVGWEKLRLGGHDPVGEAYVDFQHSLKRLINRGVVLAVVSKNEESVALEAINRHPEMVLRTSDLVGWRINWQDKAQNIVELLADLNLGLDAAVFLDDSAFERARVRETLPQILVPDLPCDVMQYPAFASQLRCFDTLAVSSEDRYRTKMYVADRGRTELRNGIGSLEQWLSVLELRIAVELLTDQNLDRAAQLFNKTNQMNLSTRRLSAAELLSWSKQEGHALWTFRISDRFGDYGLCGISSLARRHAAGQMVDFLLSCRVIGRGVEAAMLATVMHYAKDFGCERLFAEYIPSHRNEPCRKWLESLAGAIQDDNRFEFFLGDEISFPGHINISLCEDHEKVCN